MKPISYESNGFPEFLRSEAACQKAVARGLLKPDTPVVAYGDDGLRERMLASEHPLLGPLFAPSGGEAPVVDAAAPEVPATPAEPTVTAPKIAAPQIVATPPPVPSPPAPEPEPQPQAPQAQTSTTGPRGPAKAVWIIGGLALLALAISQCDFKPEEAAVEMPAAADAAAAPSEQVQAQSFYAVREVAIRTEPLKTASRVILLPRGTFLTGVQVPSQSEPGFYWLKLTDGQYAGRYVSMVNLAVESRPELDTSKAGLWYTTEALVPLVAPNDSAAAKSDAVWKLPADYQVDVAGVTGSGMFTSGWAEVMLPKQSGVGYVPLDRLSRESSALEAAEAAGVAAVDAAAAPATDSGRTLRLTNKCSNQLALLIRFYGANGWETVNVRLNPGYPTVVESGGSPIRLLTGEAYYYSLSPGSGSVSASGTGSEVYFGGRRYAMTRLNVGTGSTQYDSNFTC